MKTILTAITLSLSALVATSAMATPQDHSYHANSVHSTQAHHHAVKHNTHAQHAISHQQHWKAGNAFPHQYRGAGYKVNYKQHKNLTKPAKNQQWYQANGKYILVNTSTHSIVKVIGR